MPFQSKGLWMSKDGGCLTDGEITTYDNNASRIEPKRPHQWFMDSGEAELFPNKKQAVESNASFGGMSASTLSPWGSVSGNFNSVPGQISDRLFDAEATRSVSFDDRNISTVNAGNVGIGNSSPFGLSIAQALQDPKSGVNYGGFRKVKVSEVRDSENIMPMSVRNSYTREDSNVMSTSHGYNKVDDSGISMGLTYGREEHNVLTVGDTYGREDDNFISVSQSFNRGDVNTMAMGHNYKADNNTIPIANSFGKGDGNIMSMAENFNKGESSVTSVSQTYRSGDSSISMGNTYNKGDDSTTSIPQSSNKGETHSLSMSHSFDKGGSNIISFGGYNDDDDANASGRLICTYDLLMGQSSVPRSDSLGQKDLVVSDANALINTAQVLAVADSASKKKEDQKSTKKTPPNNFPSNVRSLLSTGILDEVPVKYIAWSREKELRGIIKGSGYLCGCQSCNFSKVINAYEFERHAGCKTKHPNNHIYFENGKTIYGIVQELRSTPQNMLFDVIQTITGSPINQKSFRLWKESFLAATRELQRIYGKDERSQPL